MPSLKRTQSPSDSSDGDPGSSGLSPSPHSRKRQRTTDSPSSIDDVVSSDRERRSLSPVTDDGVLEDEDELELRQTQIIQEKYAHIIDEANLPAEHGILERVECYNFMCHDHFQVELGPLINFIVGKNGSGKSAILTAITLCLGGKASATNRGQSLKNFIKEGKDHATIIVRIKNQGEGAYMPDDYGKSIIVERHFAKNGTAGFKIKAENGRIISNKKGELDAITDYFALQIDNPMNVLSQDMARQFLSSATPAEKYKLFVKGVQLEQLDQDYRLIEDSADQVEEKIRSSVEDLRILKERKDVAKRKLEISDQFNSVRERVQKTRSQVAWAQVEEQERIRDALTEELAKADRAIADEEAALGQFDDAFQAAEDELATAVEHVRQADSTLEEANGEREKILEKQTATMDHRGQIQSDQRRIKEYIEKRRAQMQKTQQEMDDERQRLAEVNDGGLARKQEECEQAASRAVAAREEHEQHEQSASRLQEDVKTARRAVEAKGKIVNAKKKDVEEAETRLRTLAREDGQRQSGFPDKMPQLLRAIQQEKSFSSRPIGPVGSHVTLLKPEWSSILENTLGQALSSFIVTCKRDQNLLSSIMGRVNCHCPIFIGSSGDIDTSGHEPEPQFDTALRVLQIDHPLVRAQLIINHGVEQMLLIEDPEEASSVLFDGQRPKNVKRCFCIDSTDRRRGITLSYNRMGDPNQAPVAIYKGHPRMKSDLASQISVQQGIVQDFKRQLRDAEQEWQSSQSHLNKCNQAVSQHQRQSQALKIEMQKMEDHAEALRDALDKETVEDDRMEPLRIALSELEDDVKMQEGSYEDATRAMHDVLQNLKKIRRELKAKDEDIEALEHNTTVAASEKSKVEEKRSKILSDKNVAIARIENDKKDRDMVQERREQAQARVLYLIEKSSEISPRVPVDESETVASLERKLERLARDVERYNHELGASREEIAAEAGRTHAVYLQAKRQVDELTTLVECLKHTIDHRKKRWEIFRAHISSRAKAQFTYLLSERSFRGRLLADHKNKLLDLQVEPDITKDDSTGRGARTLSGGEKSFSQICLLLALWEAMGSPIRCLDEFDVYMDHINRKMAIDMLMIAARRSIGRQFVLITPGTKTDITIAPDVRVKELAEPERGQTTLNFPK